MNPYFKLCRHWLKKSPMKKWWFFMRARSVIYVHLLRTMLIQWLACPYLESDLTGLLDVWFLIQIQNPTIVSPLYSLSNFNTRISVTIELKGTKPGFSVTSSRTNPAPRGNVTGAQTYVAFMKSIDFALTARRNNSFQLC